ncbi:hypothetical protein PAXINDRAFT_168067 [Paxillus involutus ATCC 200175]|nr:hypothetical protein PAXINDRAFT_168067 [Paxillus involutus ATCC 200175]
MSWARQLTSTVLRNAVSSSSSRSPARTTSMALLGGSRHISPRFPHTTTTPIGAYVHSIFADVLDGKEQQPEKLSPAQIWAERSAKLDLPPPPDTWTGRRIPVENGNLQAAFLKLNRRIRSNNMFKEVKLASRHEKRGDKRARLSSERWRKRFADEVRKKVQLVSTIRRRGS